MDLTELPNTCQCGGRIVRLTSHTKQHPDMEFVKCENHKRGKKDHVWLWANGHECDEICRMAAAQGDDVVDSSPSATQVVPGSRGTSDSIQHNILSPLDDFKMQLEAERAEILMLTAKLEEMALYGEALQVENAEYEYTIQNLEAAVGRFTMENQALKETATRLEVERSRTNMMTIGLLAIVCIILAITARF